MTKRNEWVWAVAILCAAGCGPKGGQGMPPEAVGTERALRTGIMGDEVGDTALPTEAVRDEATLAYLDEQTACFDVTVRSRTSEDARLRATCASGDATADASLSAPELVTVYDYDDRGQMISAVAEDVPAEGFTGGAAPEGLVRIVERRSRLCCNLPTRESLRLVLQPTANRRLELEWRL